MDIVTKLINQSNQLMLDYKTAVNLIKAGANLNMRAKGIKNMGRYAWYNLYCDGDYIILNLFNPKDNKHLTKKIIYEDDKEFKQKIYDIFDLIERKEKKEEKQDFEKITVSGINFLY